MKKIIILINAILIFFLFSVINLNSEDYIINDLGYSINLKNLDYIKTKNLKRQYTIFNQKWLEKYYKENVITSKINSTNVYSNSFLYEEEMNKSIKEKFSLDMNLGVTYDVFNFRAGQSFGSEFLRKSKSTKGSFFYNYTYDYENNVKILPSYFEYKQSYDENLNLSFLKELEHLSSKENNSHEYDNFFSKYGTHVLFEGVYGGKLDLFYGVNSHNDYISSSTQTTLSKKLDASIEGVINLNSNEEIKINEEISHLLNNYSYVSKVNALGGNEFNWIGFSNFGSNFLKWSNSIKSNPSLIKSTPDGLIPIYEIIPYSMLRDKPQFKNTMIKQFNRYFKYSNIIPKITSAHSSEIVRTEKIKIYDSGYNDNLFDYVHLYDRFKASARELKQAGYNSIIINLRFEAAYYYLGQERVAIYNSIDRNPNKIIAYEVYDIYKDFGVSHSVFVNLNYIKTFSIDEFENDVIIIGYDASGNGSDDWFCKNLHCTLTLIK